MGTERTAYRTCPLCEATCGLEIRLVDESVKVIRGDRDNPFSQGFICPKGSVLGRLHEDPDRVRTPLIKRDGVFAPVSWDEAFSEIDQRMGAIRESHGSDAVALYIGNPNAHNFANNLAIRPLAKSLRSKNIFSASTLDQMPKHISCGFMFGAASTIPVPDIDRTEFLVILGANPYESNGSLATAPDWPGRIEAIRARGGRVVVVDPRRTRTAENADQHIAVLPGSDAALLMAVINVMFDEDLIDLGHLAHHVNGLDELAAAALRFDPDGVSELVGIEAGVIRELAREIATAPSAAVYGRIGTHTVGFGTVAAWAVDVINVITGNLDKPGGVMFPLGLHQQATRPRRSFTTGRWKSRVAGLNEVLGELPASTMIDEMTTSGDGQIRALITLGGNPALTSPDAANLERALADLDFVVSIDPYLNETTTHADVVLPVPSALERSHYDMAFTTLSVSNYAMYSPPVFERPADQLSEFEILVRLTALLSGFGPGVDPAAASLMSLGAQVATAVGDPKSPIHGRDPDEILVSLSVHDDMPERFLDLMIRTGALGDLFGEKPDGWTLTKLMRHPHGVDLGTLQPRVPTVLSTASGLVELAPPVIIDDLARLATAVQNGPVDSLLLVSRRELRSNNSWLHNVEVLVKGKERCTLRVHSEDATRLAVEDGTRVLVTSSTGEIVVSVEVNDEARPGVVSMPYGWGHDRPGAQLSVASQRPGVNTNVLTDRHAVDPLSGNAVFNGIPVEIQVPQG